MMEIRLLLRTMKPRLVRVKTIVMTKVMILVTTRIATTLKRIFMIMIKIPKNVISESARLTLRMIP